MNDTITIRFTDGTERVFPKGTSLLTIAAERQKKYATSIVVARVNNMLTNIQERLEVDAEVDFFDLTTGYGVKVYERSLSFVLIVAAHRLFPGKSPGSSRWPAVRQGSPDYRTSCSFPPSAIPVVMISFPTAASPLRRECPPRRQSR